MIDSTPPREWSVEEWTEAERAGVDDFVRWWQHNHTRSAEEFPATLPLGEWDEQYRCYQGG